MNVPLKEDHPLLDLASVVFPEENGFIDVPGMPLAVYVNPAVDDILLLGVLPVNASQPAAELLTQNYPDGGVSVSVFVHESVPPSFRESVLVHELEQAWLRYEVGTPPDWAHRIATHQDMEYARTHLDADQFEEYRRWKSSLRVPEKSRDNT